MDVLGDRAVLRRIADLGCIGRDRPHGARVGPCHLQQRAAGGIQSGGRRAGRHSRASGRQRGNGTAIVAAGPDTERVGPWKHACDGASAGYQGRAAFGRSDWPSATLSRPRRCGSGKATRDRTRLVYLAPGEPAQRASCRQCPGPPVAAVGRRSTGRACRCAKRSQQCAKRTFRHRAACCKRDRTAPRIVARAS